MVRDGGGGGVLSSVRETVCPSLSFSFSLCLFLSSSRYHSPRPLPTKSEREREMERHTERERQREKIYLCVFVRACKGQTQRKGVAKELQKIVEA